MHVVLVLDATLGKSSLELYRMQTVGAAPGGGSPWLRIAVLMSSGILEASRQTFTMSPEANSGYFASAPLTPATYTAWCLLRASL